MTRIFRLIAAPSARIVQLKMTKAGKASMDIQDPVSGYIAAEQAAYEAATVTHPRVAARRFAPGKQAIWYRRMTRLMAWHRERGLDVPGALMRPYRLGVVERARAGIPLKYQYRGLNSLRELGRAHVMFPEMMAADAPLSVLDLSAGGCGIADVYGHFAHEVCVNDYFVPDKDGIPRSPYAAIHADLGLDCRHFDGRDRPYRFDSGAFDIVLCHQAIDAYGPVEAWPEALDEMLRIARRAVGLVLNPPAPRTPETEAQAAAFVADACTRLGARQGECPETGMVTLRIDKG
jgi:hypothetical protein